MNILISGGHSGIGLELSKMLAEKGHKLGLIVRNAQRAEGVAEHIGSQDIDFFYADLSVQSDVVSVAKEVTERWGTIDGLFNNAGVLLDDTYYSDQNNEMHYEVNVLASLLLAEHLAGALKNGFIVNTATGGLHNQKMLKLDTMLAPKKFVKLMGAYYQSKLAMTLLMNDFAQRHPDVRVLNADPGALKTKMTEDKNALPFFMKPLVKLLFKPPAEGAKKLYSAAFSDQFAGESGVYVSGDKVRPLKLSLLEGDKQLLLAGIKV